MIENTKLVQYYRNDALANTQYEELAKKLNDSGLTIGLYTGDTQHTGAEALRAYNTLGGLYVSDSENISVNRASITGNLADGVYMVNTSGAVIYSGYIAQNSDDGIHAS